MTPSPAARLVLIVEDNDLNMKLFRDLLEAHGYRTLHARDGRDVLALARADRPELILMDIQLPEISGIEVIAWLKATTDLNTIPIIAVTAFAMKGDEEKIRASGADDYLSKPIAITSFLATVRKYLPAPAAVV